MSLPQRTPSRLRGSGCWCSRVSEVTRQLRLCVWPDLPTWVWAVLVHSRPLPCGLFVALPCVTRPFRRRHVGAGSGTAGLLVNTWGQRLGEPCRGGVTGRGVRSLSPDEASPFSTAHTVTSSLDASGRRQCLGSSPGSAPSLLQVQTWGASDGPRAWAPATRVGDLD